jgi:CTP synthase
MATPTKTIIITGGTVSGIGKGITAASLGRLLIDAGYSVMPVKADPYLNQDAGTMNPFQHGEVFVTDDGTETDLDLGHYERFLDVNLNKFSNFTSGAVYRAVMDLEREGSFLGKTIQIIPHVTDEIKNRMNSARESTEPDFLLCEIGGTIGDIEALPFIEAVRQYKQDKPHDTIFMHVVKMDYLYPSDEGKTKPIQHAVTALRSYGIQPDVLIVRCKRALTTDEREKISLFTGVKASHIIPAQNAKSLYEIPSQLEKFEITKAILTSLGISETPKPVQLWKELYANMAARKETVTIGLVGKYVDHDDAYLSVLEAIRHAGIYHRVFTEIVPINAEDEDNVATAIGKLDAMIVPGGFGVRGIEGKIRAIQIAREKKIPYLGICLGLQTAVIEYARNVVGVAKATSSEFEESTTEPVIAILPDQLHIKKKGGTMRLGQYPAVLQKGSLAEKLYSKYTPEALQEKTVQERHRHRYEVNPDYHERLSKAGLTISGVSPDGSLVEFIELPEAVHPYFIATQAHPEFKSRPHRPHPLFAGLIAAALKKS